MWGLAAALIVGKTLQTFVVPLPPSIYALSAMSQSIYLAFAAAAWFVERPAPAR